jgi:hypothetical protein
LTHENIWVETHPVRPVEKRKGRRENGAPDRQITAGRKTEILHAQNDGLQTIDGRVDPIQRDGAGREVRRR